MTVCRKSEDDCFIAGNMTNLHSVLKIKDISLPVKVCIVTAMAFPVVTYGCECWTIKKAEHWRIDAFELRCWRRLLKSSLDNKEIKPIILKGNQPWIFTGRTDADAPIFWPPDVKSWLIRKDPDVGKDWRQEKGATEDEMVGWHPSLTGCEFEQTQGDSEGQGSLACRSSWDRTESDMT